VGKFFLIDGWRDARRSEMRPDSVFRSFLWQLLIDKRWLSFFSQVIHKRRHEKSTALDTSDH